MVPLRRWSQIIWLFLCNGYWAFPFSKQLYQGPAKILCSPGLNCYSCPAATTFCPIGALQQLLMGIRLGAQAGQYFIGTYVLGWLGLFGTLGGRFICGWVCPFGLIQEGLYRIPGPKFPLPPLLSRLKYLVLFGLVIFLPLFLVNEWGMGEPWFCKYLCPAGTLEAGLPLLALTPEFRQAIGGLFIHKLLLLILFMAWSMTTSRPFCRSTCPLGAFYGLFNRISLIRLKFNPDNCTKCGACHEICPVDLEVDVSPNSTECVRCLQCMTRACRFNALSLEVAGYELHPAPAGVDQPKDDVPAP